MKPDTNESGHGNDEKEQVLSALVAEPPRPSHSPDNGVEEKQDKEIQALSKRVDLGLWFSGVVACAAVISALVAYLQWDAIRGNGEQTDRLIAQVTEQAKAANRLAEIANASLSEGRDHSRRDLRPYILPTIEPGALIEGVPVRAKYSLINYGKTPALKMRTYGKVFVGRNALKEADQWFAERVDPGIYADFGAPIPPGVPNGLNKEKYLLIPNERPMSKEDIALVRDRDFTVVIVSRHYYLDGFGETYWTDACFMMLKTWEAGYCQHHNEIH